MRILSLRRGFEADHSSSTYEFFALDRLTAEQCAAVRDLTGESPRRHLSFQYMGDWSDIPHLSVRVGFAPDHRTARTSFSTFVLRR